MAKPSVSFDVVSAARDLHKADISAPSKSATLRAKGWRVLETVMDVIVDGWRYTFMIGENVRFTEDKNHNPIEPVKNYGNISGNFVVTDGPDPKTAQVVAEIRGMKPKTFIKLVGAIAAGLPAADLAKVHAAQAKCERTEEQLAALRATAKPYYG